MPEAHRSSPSYPVSIRRPSGRLVHHQDFAQIPRKIRADALRITQAIGDRLGRDGRQDRGQETLGVGHERLVMAVGPQRGVLGDDGDGPAAARGHLVDVIDHLRLVTGYGDEQDGVAVAHRRQRLCLNPLLKMPSQQA